jgi:hypothetical protein
MKFKVAYCEPLTITAEMKDDVAAVFLHRLVGAKTQPHRNLMAASKLEYTTDVILMLVSNDNACKVCRGYLQPLQASLCLANGKPAIQHDSSTRRAGCSGNQQRIALAAAS